MTQLYTKRYTPYQQLKDSVAVQRWKKKRRRQAISIAMAYLTFSCMLTAFAVMVWK